MIRAAIEFWRDLRRTRCCRRDHALSRLETWAVLEYPSSRAYWAAVADEVHYEKRSCLCGVRSVSRELRRFGVQRLSLSPRQLDQLHRIGQLELDGPSPP